MVPFDLANHTYKTHAKGPISYYPLFIFRFILFYEQNSSWNECLKHHRTKSSNNRVLPPWLNLNVFPIFAVLENAK